MEKYLLKAGEYEVFSANMTMDTRVTDKYLGDNLSACKHCQCHCRTCLGGMAPKIAEIICEKDAENTLEMLLAA